ncbi:MAG TPA: class I SAM-dependent methyltransferase [Polyangiaceae bacterium]|nr:class I SAM-dependent methyltransferase [Polyangiaceae bacterium]
MPAHDWDQHYASGELPWDTGDPDPHLVELVEQRVITPGRTLDVGCGTGTNAIWLSSRGFEVYGIDVAPLAIEKAEVKRRAAGTSVRFSVLDFLREDLTFGAFDFVFDRGVFHVFDDVDERARFAERVARVLSPNGHWLSLVGSTEGPRREHGPPRRSARDVVAAVEPVLELVQLRSSTFDADLPSRAMAWVMLARARAVPAQPPTGNPVPL